MRNTMHYSGIITNYSCSAACRHCMFASSPRSGKAFITGETAERIVQRLKSAGVRSMHIGGGEPFLNFDALCALLKEMQRAGIGVDYIETNAFWCRDEEETLRRLRIIRSLGADTVMASVDPFHIEFVPLERPIRLVQALRKLGMDYFIWQDRFLERLLPLDLKTTHTREELAALLGEDYIEDTAQEYGVKVNGRALAIAKKLYVRQPAEKLATAEPCAHLLSGQHCHVDLYEKVVPSGCPGIAIDMEDFFERRLPVEKYPCAYRLYTGGLKALYEYACGLGFEADPAGYPTRCSLCYAVREWLHKNSPSDDVAPGCFYREMERTMEEE
ncbi:MAG: radical SAM protein [Clostridia bacterium]|nr:radical SAM protein [Clostridia bacterium]